MSSTAPTLRTGSPSGTCCRTHPGLPTAWLDRPKAAEAWSNRVLEEGDREFTTEEMMAFVRDELKPHFPPQDLSAGRPKIATPIRTS